jgi:hypothetical protein
MLCCPVTAHQRRIMVDIPAGGAALKKAALLLTNSLLLGLLTIACSMAPVDRDALKTEVAATIYAELTAQSRKVSATVSPVATPTVEAKDVSTPTSTVPPIDSPTSTPTTMPARTPTPSPVPADTPTSGPCLPEVAFVEDVTVPDGTDIAAGESFTKTWRLLSDGCAPWPAGSTLVFDSGDQMDAPKSVSVPQTPLGNTADVSVEMTAPDVPGTYQGFWQMQDANGVRFGSRVYVLITVPGPTPTPRACPPEPALVEAINELSIQLTVEVTGPQSATFVLPADAVQRYCTAPGEYSFVARATGYNPLTGTKTSDSGACQCWWFYSGIRVHPICNCDSDATHYGPLP